MTIKDGFEITVICIVIISLWNYRIAGHLLLRFLTGMPMTGRNHTGSTFFFSGAPGQSGVTQSSWNLRPGYQRAFYRMGALLCFGTLLYLVIMARSLALIILAIIVLPLLTLVVRHLYLTLHNWRHNRNVVTPLALGLRTIIPKLSADHRRWLTVPTRYNKTYNNPVEVILPDAWVGSAAQKKAVDDFVCDRLDGEWQAEWRMTLHPAMVVWHRLKPLPADLKFADVSNVLYDNDDTTVILGPCRNGNEVNSMMTIDLDDESPHVLISAGTGAGKSTLLRLILMQLARKGALIYIIDLKRVSQNWARGIPNIRIFKRVEDAHEALESVAAEIQRRFDVLDNDGDVGRRVVIVVEELNYTMRKLNRLWRDIKGPNDPKVSPAVDALEDLAETGRQALMHAVFIAQMATSKATGGSEIRENFAVRILARFTVNAWKMLVPEVWPPPRSSEIVGRWQVVKASVAYETHVIDTTDDEARSFVMTSPELTTGSVAMLPSVVHSDELDPCRADEVVLR